MNDNGQHRVPLMIIRKSAVLLGLSLMAIELIVLAIILSMRIPGYVIDDFKETLFNINTWAIAGIILVKSGLVIYIVLNWVNEYYEIYPDEIRHRKGVLHLKEKQYLCNHSQRITISQDLIGKLFKFGTITIYNPALDQLIRLGQITNPERQAEIIREIQGFSGKDDSQKSTGQRTFIMKQ